MRNLLVLLAVFSGVILDGCKRAPVASPEFAEASQEWQALVRDQLDDAYLDPQVDALVEKLGRVDPASFDAQAAAELKARLEKGKKEALAEAESRRKAGEAPQPVAFVPAEGGVAASAEDADAGAPAAADQPDAGPGNPEAGMSEADFRRRFARCFELVQPVPTSTGPGQLWGLQDLLRCRELHPGFESKGVLLTDGKVVSVGAMADLKPRKFRVVDGGFVPVDEEAEEKAPRKAAPPAPVPAEGEGPPP